MMRLTRLSSATLAILACFLLLATVAVTVPSSSTGDTFPKVIYGFIRDSEGTPLVGADVTVNIKRPDTSIRATLTDTSDSSAGYMVSFEPEDWDLGDNAEVIANYQGHQDDNSTLPFTDEEPQWLNLTYIIVIPEFGSATGLLVTGALLGAVGVVALVYFKKR